MGRRLAVCLLALILAGCTQGSPQPSANPCADPSQAYMSNAYSHDVNQVLIGAQVVVQNPTCFDATTRAAAQAWLDWWNTPKEPSGNAFSGPLPPKFPP
jgi:hypothetical protein